MQSQVAGRLNSLGQPGGPIRYTLFTKQPPPGDHPWPHVRTVVFQGWDKFSIAWSEYTAAHALGHALKRVHREDPLDLIDLHAGGTGPIVSRWSKRSRVPYVFVSHSIRFFTQRDHGFRWELARYYAWTNRRAAQGARRIIAVSAALKSEWVRFGLPAEKIDVLRTATTDPPETWDGQPRSAGPLRLLYVGRTQWEKGPDVLLESLLRCRSRGVDTTLTIVGPVPDGDSLRRSAVRDGLDVRFAGPQSNEVARRMMAQSDALIIPSRYDSCPVVAIEGLAAGALIIASRVGGLPEQIEDGETGLLVPEDNPDALASAIQRVAADENLAARLRRAALEAGWKHRWSHRAAEILESYRQTAAAEPRES